MKRRISAILLAAALMLTLTTGALADGGAVARIESAGLDAPGDAELAVRITGNPGLAAWKLMICWDAAEFTLDKASVRAGEAFSSGTCIFNADTPGQLTVVWYSVKNVTEDGDMLTFRLTAAPDLPDGAYKVELRCSPENTLNAKEERVSLGTAGGTITVGTPSDAGGKPETDPPGTDVPPASGEQPGTPPDPDQPPESGQEQPAAAFADVAADAYYGQAVRWAVEHGITAGTSPTTFSPDQTCTRGQTVTFLWRAAGEPKPLTEKNPFADVKPEDYFYTAVLWAVEQGITKGISATAFGPDAPVTRGQVVTFLHRQEGEPAAEGANPFRDVGAADYCCQAVLWAARRGITTGTSETTFSPDQPCTRGQIVTFLHRAAA